MPYRGSIPRRSTDMGITQKDAEYTIEECSICGWTVICPKCGNNCCNGGYGEIDGETCDVCPDAYAYQKEVAKTRDG